MPITRNDRFGVAATIGIANNLNLGIGTSATGSFTGTPDNGTLVMHGVSFNAANSAPLTDIDTMTVTNVATGASTYTPNGSRGVGDNVVYNIHAKDIANWAGTVTGSLPATGTNGDIVRFGANYYRRTAGAWVNEGGNPNIPGVIDNYFSSIGFTLAANTGGGGGGTGGTIIANHLVNVGATAGIANNISLGVAFTGTPPNGTLVLHGLDFNGPLNTPLPDIDSIIFNRSLFTAGYNPSTARTDGDTIVYNIHAKDAKQWQGVVNSLPSSGQFGDTLHFNSNYWRYEWDGVSQNDWVNRGGNPTEAGVFDDYFSSVQFVISVPTDFDPVAEDKTVTISENSGPVTISLVAFDPDGTIVGYSYTNAANGNFNSPSVGVVEYTPDADFFGTDSFTFTVTDDDGNTATGTVTINVLEGSNFQPTAKDRDILTGIGTATEATLLGSDIDGTVDQYNILQAPANGTLSGAAPDIIYTPDPSFTGVDSFIYSVVDDNDSESFSAIIRIRVRPPHDCNHMRISKNNLVAHSELQLFGGLVADTPIEYLTNEHRARKFRVSDLSNEVIRIWVNFKETSVIDYVAIPGSNLRADAEIAIQFYHNVTDTTAFYTDNWQVVGQESVGNNNTWVKWYDESIIATLIVVNIRHRHGFVEAGAPPPIVLPDGIPLQDATTGILSIEAESGKSVAASGEAWQVTSDPSAASNAYMRRGAGQLFFSAFDAPYIEYDYTSAYAGLCEVWLRVRSEVGGGNQIAASYEGSAITFRTFTGTNAIIGLGWQWRSLGLLIMPAGQRRKITVYARAQLMDFDKLVIQPSNLGAPTGEGPPLSTEGTTTITQDGESVEGQSVDLRMLMAGEATIFDRNYQFGSKLKPFTDPSHVTSSSGHLLRSARPKKSRRLELSYPAMTEEDRRRMYALEDESRGDPMIVSCLPERERWLSSQYEFLGYLENSLEYTHVSDQRHTAGWRLGEV